MTEKEKMLAGQSYNPMDAQLRQAREQCHDLCRAFNDLQSNKERRQAIRELLGYAGMVYIEPPFFCDYGSQIIAGKQVFLNTNCVILDAANVTIGDHVMVGPGVHIYTAKHPIDAVERRSWLQSAAPVSIGCDVWIGGGAILCPGVSIGERSVIGAGSVVTQDIPADVVAAGNPCRVIRPIAAEK